MTDYDNNQRGVLFRNRAKREGKKDSDYRGNATVDGVEYYLDAWVNEPKAGGDKFLSVKFKAKEQQAAKPIASEPPPFDDFLEVPF
jgi:hypothetical protein